MRADNALTEKRVYEFGSFRIETMERVLTRDGRALSVAPKALDVLIVLLENRGRIVEKEDLMRKVWPETFVEDNNLAFNVSVLRKLFGESGASPQYIETVPKRGYRFMASVAEVPNGKPAPLDAAPSAPTSVPAPGRHSRYWFHAAALFTLAAAGILTSRFRRVPKLTDRDNIVLADFVNKTGDPVFDGTLQQGLTVQLEQSPFLSLVSEQRIARTVRLMNQPADVRLSPELARGVCERMGGGAVVEGSISSIGTSYVLGLRARNCGTGDVLAEEQAQAARKEDVLNTMSQIANKFRTRVGESISTVEKHDTPLEATTSSLEALQAYSEGRKVQGSRGTVVALRLFQRAVEIDPNFAAAHNWMAGMYGNLDEFDLAAESITKAYLLRDRASDAERFSITAFYDRLVTGNMEKVQRTCELWSQTYPRDATPHGLLASTYCTFGKYEQALEQSQEAVKLDPDFAMAYYGLAARYLILDHLREAEDILQRAAERKLDIQELYYARHNLAFLKGDKPGMEKVLAESKSRSEAEALTSEREAFALAYAGHLKQARNMMRRAADLARQSGQRERSAEWEAGAALWEVFFGNAAAAREGTMSALQHFRGQEVRYMAALALALSGDSPRSQALANELEKRFPENTSVQFNYLPTLRARLALNHGDPAKAIELLEPAVRYEMGTPRVSGNIGIGALYPIYVRGEAYLAEHQGAKAAAEFQRILDHRGIVLSDPIGVLARLQMGRALVFSGDKAKAKAAYQEFLTLWKDADADIPVLKQAKAEFAALN
jgi:eukaryotic-like serine/threonine-protein kinase